MPSATEQEAVISYPDWKKRFHRELRQNAEMATLEKVRRGEAVGRLPLGYEYGRDGKPDLDPLREAPLRMAFLLAAEGQLSLRKILELTTEKGLTARSSKFLSVSQLWRILTDPFYCGKVQYREEIVLGKHQPLVSEETFNTALRSIVRRSKKWNKNPKA